MIDIILGDCMDIMPKYKDKHFDLAIVDPPYGIGEDGLSNHSRGGLAEPKLYTPKDWDKCSPSKDYFNEVIRVSKNQIIFGANHFISKIPYDSSCWIVWDKDNFGNDFADCELAWTSFDSAVRKYKFRWSGMLQEDMKNKEERIHPTQKPVKLYEWILHKYSESGQNVNDTHLGSGSIAIACHNYDINLVGIEIDEEYYNNAKKRVDNLTRQYKLF